MLELFSRVPDSLTIDDASHLTPIPITDDVSSLSAILVDDEYYQFIQSGRDVYDGLPLARADRLMALTGLSIRGRSRLCRPESGRT
jgi:hypothetical protein